MKFERQPLMYRSRKVEVSEGQEKRVQELLSDNITISLHDHPVVVPEDINEIFEQKRLGRDFTAFEGLAASGLDCVLCASAVILMAARR